MSATVVTVAVTTTASQSVVVVTSTIAASDLSSLTGSPTSSASAGSSIPTSSDPSSSSTSANGAGSSSGSDPTSRAGSTPIGAIVGGAVGGAALLALLLLLACLYRRRSNAKRKAANPFPDDTDEKGPAVIAGLPPNPSSSQARPLSGSYSNSLFMTEANSSLPLLGTERSFHSGSHPNAGLASDARSNHAHRPSMTSLAPSFVMGSSASFAQSHNSHFGQPMNGNHINCHDSATTGFAGAYPDVHRSAYYDTNVPSGVDPRTMGVGSAAAAYTNGSAATTMPGSPAQAYDPRSLPMGAAPSEYTAASEAARTRGMSLSGSGGESQVWSGAASPNDARSRRGSHGSALAMPRAASAHSHDEVESLQSRRPPAAGLNGFPSTLNTIPGSVAASEIASADQHSMQSAGYSSFGERSIPPRLPSISSSSPLMMQGASSFAPHASMAAGAALPAAHSSMSPRLTSQPGADTLQSSDPSNGGTFNSDGTYNTYTGAVKGQLRVVGATNEHGKGPPTIAEEAEDRPRASAAMKRLGQHSASASTSSVNRTGSRMVEMLDVNEQPHVPDSVTGADEGQTASPPTRPSFWKERSRSAQSITKVFRSSPLLSAQRSPATDASTGQDAYYRASENEALPSPDTGRSVAAETASESHKTDGDAEMWKGASKSKSRQAGGLRKWTMRRIPQPGAKGANEVDVDQLFR
ncbi:hypothetical protein PHSY_001277 [Pseudozyma hubeiensis SY62]|uniref:Uncharacterized protein n=1 Tax=Pseudozyma hubeiensis (strain SY62) TaxID=1305764 RepID=R9NYJ0_PSEHS|nr:hypothetical protein PHSY_001277 [Pseudozyma hubeiensis SY62]GAC93712.1 hypothetical protein PHSY_001277 [Pseudozyma hubeiensis SY62]